MTMRTSMRLVAAAATFFICLTYSTARAEPYFAVREGMKCANCHVSPSGGGMRNPVGNSWAQTALPQQRIEVPGVEPWTGAVNRYLSVGGNLRAGYTYTHVPGSASVSEFDVEAMRAYLAVAVIPERLLLYVDELVAPGGATNLEVYARYSTADQRWYVRAGQFYLPYGWRLEDDSAFVRQVTGINFASPDKGVEVGWESAAWTAQLAVTNGTASGPEEDHGKQFSLRAEHVQSVWRVGAGFNFNDADIGERRMQGVFAGLRTGPIAWLVEADYVVDDAFDDGRRRQWVGLLEGNWNFMPGHNFKVSAEYFEPDTDVDEDEQNRFSVVWEYVPFQFLQVRAGARVYDGIPQNALQNREMYFVSAHGFF